MNFDIITDHPSDIFNSAALMKTLNIKEIVS
jgi:hypothetical protein